MSVERRECPRFKVSVPVEICPEGTETPIRYSTSDLSLGGCYVESIFPFPVGTRLELKLQLEDTLLIMGRAVTCDPQVGNGIHFDRMLPEDIEQLRDFLKSLEMQAEAATQE
jgi:c-di-GMP-binding flagellar brake protein YcgR